MYYKISRTIAALFIALVANVLIAAENEPLESPNIYLEKVADAMITEVEKNRAELKTNKELASSLVHSTLIPAIDTKVFARLTLTSKKWKTFSQPQQERFTKSFIDLVVGNYASGLSFYDGQKFKFSKPIFSKSGKSAKVRSSMQQAVGNPIIIDYKLSNKTGSWKIIDLTIEGVNMVKSYRTQFLPRLKSLGVDGFLDDMEAKKG
ncbi:MAG: ABC transporter substrate-binding protein [Kangiellaceae bacterium]|nr:ABC transporter substrate-binding protein [Kangiellaceae bacterium]